MTESTPRPVRLDDRGSVSLIAVICLGAFACLFFAIANLSVAYTEKIELQNAEDASVISGSTLIARGLNLVAMNNSTQAKMFAVATIWFAMDKVLPGITIALEALAAIPYVGWIAKPSTFVAKAWRVVLNLLRRVFMEPSGLAWKIMQVLSSFSGAIVKAMPAFAALEAFRIARRNGATFGMMISPSILRGEATTSGLFLVEFPVKKGKFADFCAPGSLAAPRTREMIKEVRKGTPVYVGWDIGLDPFYAIVAGIGALVDLAKGDDDAAKNAGDQADEAQTSLEEAGIETGLAGGVLNLAIEAYLKTRCAQNTGKYAPWMLDRPLSKTRERLTYFGFVYRKKTFKVAPDLFKDMIWGDKRFAYAQTRVYNASAFDSFSQDWRVKLVPADLLNSGLEDAGTSGKASAVPGLKDLIRAITTRVREYVPTTH